MTVLLTGFEPFGGAAANPSGDAVTEAARLWTGSERLVTAVLPVAFDAAAAELCRLIDAHEPSVVLATGLAGGRGEITPERVALNLRDARIPDNAGAQPVDEPSVPGGPAAHFATVPVKAMVSALAGAGLPASLSHSAGTFVCNHVFYVAAHEAARHPGRRAGFVHVPWSTATAPAGAPSLPAAEIARGIIVAVRTALDVTRDPDVAGGTLH